MNLIFFSEDIGVFVKWVYRKFKTKDTEELKKKVSSLKPKEKAENTIIGMLVILIAIILMLVLFSLG